MSKHLNILGYSIWELEQKQRKVNELSRSALFYSAYVIVAYSVLVNWLVGSVLYGLNLTQRGSVRAGKLIALLSGLLLILQLILSRSIFGDFRINLLMAINLYYLERPLELKSATKGFNQSWWLPLVVLMVVFIAIKLIMTIISLK